MEKPSWIRVSLVVALSVCVLGVWQQAVQAQGTVSSAKMDSNPDIEITHVAAKDLDTWLYGKKLAFIEFYSPT